MSGNSQHIDDLIQLLAQTSDPEDLKGLLEDLCTAKELENMAERCYAARLLLEGKTYNQVMELVEISSATLSRVSRCVQYGKGYSKLLKEE
jgi:TrpR-related protein YerC/YecD